MPKATLNRVRISNRDKMFRDILKLGASSMVIGGLLAGQAVAAQDQTANNPAQEPGQVNQGGEPTVVDDNVIVVSGIRQSLANAQNIKRDSDTVVDAITAEDIGALPDRSVTEALQRVPGIAINRFAGSNDPDHFSVEGSGVTVRGLNFVRSEFNGRTAFAAGVGGQALNFADVPSELLGSVVISKNATAELIEGGLAGTVNLITRKPFDSNSDDLKIAFSAEANYGDFAKKWTPNISGLLSKSWTTDAGRFGVLVSGAYSQIKSRADGVQIANYQTRDGTLARFAGTNRFVCRNPLPAPTDNMTLPPPGAACGDFGAEGSDGFADYADFRVAPVGGQFRTQEFNRKRDGIAASAQWESLDEDTRLTAEFIRSHTTNNWGEYTYETAPDLTEYSTYPLGCQQNANGPAVIDSNGVVNPDDETPPRAQCPVGGYQDFVYDDNGLFQSGYIVDASNGWRGDPAVTPFVPIGGSQFSLARRQVDDETTNEDYSLHLYHKLTDRLTMNLDAQYATSERNNLDVSVFGSLFADQELDISGEYPIIIPHRPQFLGYTWSGPTPEEANAARPELNALSDAEYFSDPRIQFWRAAMDHAEDSKGKQFAFSADFAYDIGEDAFLREVKFGARYQGREQDVRYTTYNWGKLSEVWTGGRPVNFADTAADASNRYEFPDFFRGEVPAPPGAFYYSGDLTGDYEGAIGFFQGVQDLAVEQGGNRDSNWTPLGQRAGAIAGTPYTPFDVQTIDQDDYALYGLVRFGSDDMFGNIRFSGNVGVRYVNTEVRSGGTRGPGEAGALGFTNEYAVQCAPVERSEAQGGGTVRPGGLCTLGEAEFNATREFLDGSGRFELREKNYDYFLPSLNLKFGLTDDLILRLAGSKVLTRPENSYIRNYFTPGFTPDGIYTAQAGNPDLVPATAWQFDAGLEWYFARVGSLTFNAFYKDIRNFFYNETRELTIANGVNDTRSLSVRGPANFDGKGEIKGFEVAYQQTFDFLPSPLDGFGVQANYTYIESSGLPNTFLNGAAAVNDSTVPPGNLPLEQLSKHNYNVAGFYEKGPLSVRAAYNWRSRFLLTAADVIFPYYSIFNEPTGQLDASIFLNVGQIAGLPGDVRIGVQGVNLLNEVTKTTQAYTGDPDVLAPRSYFMNDRRFSFILRGNF